ncbi:MAG TPA: T9SS type A sorting domain-containing protein [Rhodothermia bacterium]|nr:T9SS type A sorting domain-containing protein [Rhodothermia bacterium]
MTNRYLSTIIRPLASSVTTGLVWALILGTWTLLLGQAECSTEDGQRICVVEQGLGTLNLAIDGDTTGTGERVDENTIYQLASGGTYLLTGSIENRFPLTIMAEPGATERPRLIPAVDEGGESARPFRPRDDLYLNGIYVTGEDELGGFPLRILRVSADSVRIVLENVHLDRDGQSAFRLDNADARIFINNSIVSNIGVTGDPNNGRVIDDRGNSIDTLMVTNSTFYNITSRTLRDDGGPNNFVYFRHNTFMNHGQMVVTFGQTSSAHFVNNVVVNGGFYGATPTNPGYIQVSVDSVSEGEQSVVIANNVFYLDPAITDAQPDSASVVPWFNATADAFIAANGHGDSNFEEEIAFTNGPDEPSATVTAFYALDPDPPALDNGLTGDRTDPEVDVDPFDFSYSDATIAYTASTHGQPLGDLGYFELVPTTNEADPGVPQSFRLIGNYPNPFNPSTTVAFELDDAAEVGLTIFDAMGREVMSIQPEMMAAGESSILLRADNLASGLYMYRLEARTASETLTLQGRMTLLK